MRHRSIGAALMLALTAQVSPAAHATYDGGVIVVPMRKGLCPSVGVSRGLPLLLVRHIPGPLVRFHRLGRLGRGAR